MRKLLKAKYIVPATTGLTTAGVIANRYFSDRPRKPKSKLEKLFLDYWHSLDRKQQNQLNKRFEKQEKPDVKGFATKLMSDPDKPVGKRRQRSDKGKKRGKYKT